MRLPHLIISLFLFFILQAPALAWDAVGHKVIALIAYQHLTPQAKQKIDQITLSLDPHYPPLQRFLYDAVWADHLRERSNALAASHYIHYLHPATENVVAAISLNAKIVNDESDYSIKQRARALRLLIHFVGDVHHPLHCIGDYEGGNLFWIKTLAGKYINLHYYWDEGLGLFQQSNKNLPLTPEQIALLASAIQRDYPETFFKNSLTQTNPQQWALESFLLAKNFSLHINQNAVPDAEYCFHGHQIIEQRIALAGYRLARMLNAL